MSLPFTLPEKHITSRIIWCCVIINIIQFCSPYATLLAPLLLSWICIVSLQPPFPASLYSRALLFAGVFIFTNTAGLLRWSLLHETEDFIFGELVILLDAAAALTTVIFLFIRIPPGYYAPKTRLKAAALFLGSGLTGNILLIAALSALQEQLLNKG